MRYSIILPVRNGERTLPNCLSALLDQPCRDMEILLLDQGSEDGTAMLCRGYQKAYPDMVRFFRQEGTDWNAVRNAAIRQARGDYLLFADCSGRMRPEAMACLSRRIDETHADLYLPGAAAGQYGREAFSLESHPELLLRMPDIRDVLWKRRLFDDAYLRFPEVPGYGDLRMISKALALCQSIAVVPEGIWQDREQKRTGQVRELAVLDALDDIRAYFHRRGVLECYSLWLTRLAGLLICDRAYEVLTSREDPVCLTECIRYLKNRFPDYSTTAMYPWRGQETEKLLTLIEQERWTRLRLIFRLKGREKSGPEGKNRRKNVDIPMEKGL